MKNIFKKLFIYFESLLVFFYLSSAVSFVIVLHNPQNSLVKITDFFLLTILWPFLLAPAQGDKVGLAVTILYYVLLFLIPVIGLFIYKKKYLIVHSSLIALVMISLIELLYIFRGLSQL